MFSSLFSRRCGQRLLWLGLVVVSIWLAANRWFAAAQAPLQGELAVVSAASYEPDALAPDALAVVFGFNLALRTEAAASGAELPVSLGGRSVRVTDGAGQGALARLLFVSPTQINLVLPAAVAPGAAMLAVLEAGTNRELMRTSIRLNRVAPALFTANANGQGAPLGYVLRVRAGGASTTEPLAQFSAACNCFVPRPLNITSLSGEQVFLVLFGTGWRNRAALAEVQVFVGGAASTATFAGAQSDFAGLDQINVPFPLGGTLPSPTVTGAGRLNVALSVAGNASNVVEIVRMQPAVLPGAVRITGFDPPSALAGGELTIRGANFAPTTDSIFQTVQIGEQLAPVIAASATELRVRVPYGVESAPVRVRVRLSEAVSATPLPVRTSLSGIVEDTRRRPLPGVRVSLLGTNTSALTNAEGLFVLPDPRTDRPAVLAVDGGSLEATPEFPRLLVAANVQANRDNFNPRPLVLPQANGTAVKLALPRSTEEVFAPWFALTEQQLWPALGEEQQTPTGAITLTLANNTFAIPECDEPVPPTACLRRIEELTVAPLESFRVPAAPPRGHFSAAPVFLSPAKVNLSPGGKLSFPNSEGWPAGATVKLFHLDQWLRSITQPDNPTLGQFIEIPGRLCFQGLPCEAARVSADGQRVETDADAVQRTGLYFASLLRPTATIIGRVVEPFTMDGIVVIGGDTLKRPLPRVIVTARGQSTLTDDNGGFVLRGVPVLGANDKATLEITAIQQAARVERLLKADVALSANTAAVVGEIVIEPVSGNRPPVVIAGARLSADEGKTTDFNFLASDPDAGQALQVSLSGPPFATLIDRGAGRYTLRVTPGFDDAGEYPASFIARDSAGATTTQAITLTVVNVNQPPRALPQTVSTDEDKPLDIMLTGSDPDRNALRFTVLTPPAHGRLSGNAPDLRYTPNADFNGNDSFTFKVNDGLADSAPATVTINVRAANDTPVLNIPDEQRGEPGRELSFTVTADDPDVTDVLRLTASDLPSGATFTEIAVSAARAAGRFAWTPTAAQAGVHIVTLKVTDNGNPVMTTTRAVAVSVGGAAATQWTALGQPLGGAALNMTAQGDTVVANAPNGEFLSSDRGQSWRLLHNGLPSVSSGSTLTAFTNDAMFLAPFAGSLYRSNDQGRSWQFIGNRLPRPVSGAGAPFPQISGLGANGNAVYLALDNRLLRSTDNGDSWTDFSQGLPLVSGALPPLPVRFAFAGATVFAGISSTSANDTAIYRRDANAAAWQALPNVPPLALVQLLVKGQFLFAGLFDTSGQPRSGLYRYDLTARTATRVLPDTLLLGLAVKGESLYASSSRGILRSDDNGATWIPRNNGLPPSVNPGAFDVRGLAVSGDALVLATGRGPYRSLDDGANWTLSNTGYANVTIFSLLPVRVGETARLFAGTSEGALVSGDAGQSWQPRNQGFAFDDGLPRVVFSLVNAGDALLALTLNGVFRSTNLGETWSLAANGLPPRTFFNKITTTRTAAFVHASPERETPGPALYRSLNQGQSWETAARGLPANFFVYDVAGVGDVTAAALGLGGIYLSADNGATWRASTNGLPARFLASSLVSLNDALYAFTSDGVYVTANRGQSWARANAGLPDGAVVGVLYTADNKLFAVVAPSPDDPNVVELPLPEPQLFVSTNGGQSWARFNASLAENRLSALTALGGRLFAGTNGGGVWVR